jgi:tRNA U34 5-carboxymethylaminomethyl modifying GTPase MnmE/TrmE
MNALTREQTSIVHHLPGATRDAVGARINCAGLVVDIYDLPGFRQSADTIEQEAIAIAKTMYEESDLVLSIADIEHEWLAETKNLAILVGTKSDLGTREDADVHVCATSGDGIPELAALVRETFVPKKDIKSDRPWFFTGYKPTDEKPQSTYKT